MHIYRVSCSKLYAVIFILFTYTNCWLQNIEIDSLQSILKSSTDTAEKIDLLLILSSKLLGKDDGLVVDYYKRRLFFI